jgi:hypothetical protein
MSGTPGGARLDHLEIRPTGQQLGWSCLHGKSVRSQKYKLLRSPGIEVVVLWAGGRLVIDRGWCWHARPVHSTFIIPFPLTFRWRYEVFHSRGMHQPCVKAVI